MKNRVIAILLWIIIWSWIWIFQEIQNRSKQEKNFLAIQNQIKILEYKKKQKILENYKKDILSKLDNDTNKKNEKQNQNLLNIKIYDFNLLYNEIYNIIINDNNVKEKVWYKSFKNTILFKRLEDLKEWLIHTTVIYEKNKLKKEYDFLPIDYSCKKIWFCKKKLIKNINEIYMDNKNIVKYIKVKNLKINKKIISNLFLSNKSLYQFFLENNKFNKKNKE